MKKVYKNIVIILRYYIWLKASTISEKKIMQWLQLVNCRNLGKIHKHHKEKPCTLMHTNKNSWGYQYQIYHIPHDVQEDTQ